ncbi:MAG: YraN family protein [Hyphomicrobiales bacterium]|nr:MAG: YraN family protein [Hyphomicrobiales bacterium]
MPPSPSKPRNSQPDKLRQGAEIYGRRGETLAAWFLRLKGYRILETRYRTPIGEIDLIARRFGTTVFVEVKSRRTRDLERDALLAVNQARIIRAAQYYVSRHPALVARPLRFDVIFLAPRMWPRHVMNAFDAS